MNEQDREKLEIAKMDLDEYIGQDRQRLAALRNSEDLKALYEWRYELLQQEPGSDRNNLQRIVDAMNARLGLTGNEDFMLRPCLPVQHAGSTEGLIITSAEPKYDCDATPNADAECSKNVERYWNYANNYFCVAKEYERGRRAVFWTKALRFQKLHPSIDQHYGSLKDTNERWQVAREERLAGGWDLFPFYSYKDGISDRLFQTGCEWLTDWIADSMSALLRMRPRVLLVAARKGHDLVLEVVRSKNERDPWKTDGEMSVGSYRFRTAYCRLGTADRPTEIIAIRAQLFSLRTGYRFESLVQQITTLRRAWENEAKPWPLLLSDW